MTSCASADGIIFDPLLTVLRYSSPVIIGLAFLNTKSHDQKEKRKPELWLRWGRIHSASSEGNFSNKKLQRSHMTQHQSKLTAIQKARMKTIIKLCYLSGTLPNALITTQKPLIKKSACRSGQG